MGNMTESLYLGFDPGTKKCGLAIVNAHKILLWRGVIAESITLQEVIKLSKTYLLTGIVIGSQTGSQVWQARLRESLPQLPLHVVDEQFSSQTARLRYWDFYAAGWQSLLPRGLRVPDQDYDDLVALILVERFLDSFL